MAGCNGHFLGHDIEQVDAEQAYVQAEVEGAETWVALPPEAWPDEWKIKGCNRPVVRLKKALYVVWAPRLRDDVGETLS